MSVQGSGTVAMTTAASITAPILIASDTVSPLLGAVACCVGSLFFAWFNDSYFSTGGETNWKTVETNVRAKNPITGIHDIYFLFRGGDKELFNFNYWYFK